MKCLDDREQKRMEYQNKRPNAIWFQRNPKRPTMTADVCRVNNAYSYEVYDTASPTPFKPILKGSEPSLAQAKGKVLARFEAV